MKEIWKDIIGYEGYYKVSNLGNVKGIPRKITNTLGREYDIPGKTINKCVDRYGYNYIGLYKNGKQTKYKIHRLVAIAFIPNINETVNHKDCIKTNNNYKNLEWVSAKENSTLAAKNGLYNSARGEQQGSSYLTSDMVKTIRKLSKLDNKNVEISKLLNINQGLVGKIVRRERWKHI